MREELERIFAYYASFGDRLNTKTLGQQQFNLFLKDCQLYPSPGFQQVHVDLLFREILNEHGSLKFDVFCDTLPTIAVARFSKENEIPSHEAFRTLLCNHVLPLAYRRRLDPGIRELTSEAVQAVFRKYRKPLRKVFKRFSVFEQSGSSWEDVQHANETMSFKELTKLLQEFSVVPDLLSLAEAQDIFRSVSLREVREEFSESGDDLTFDEFEEVAGRVALAAFARPPWTEMFTSPEAKVEGLFKRMDLHSAHDLQDRLNRVKSFSYRR